MHHHVVSSPRPALGCHMQNLCRMLQRVLEQFHCKHDRLASLWSTAGLWWTQPAFLCDAVTSRAYCFSKENWNAHLRVLLCRHHAYHTQKSFWWCHSFKFDMWTWVEVVHLILRNYVCEKSVLFVAWAGRFVYITFRLNQETRQISRICSCTYIFTYGYSYFTFLHSVPSLL